MIGLVEIEKQCYDRVHLRHRYTGQRVSAGLAVPLVDKITVSNNWSEEKICLTCGNFSQSIGGLFTHSLVIAAEATPDNSSKRQKCLGMADTPPKALGCPPKHLALADRIGVCISRDTRQDCPE